MKALSIGGVILLWCGSDPLLGQQVGIGTSTPHPSAQLDISAPDRGILIPRIGLTALNNPSPIVASPATGLLVFNDGSAGLYPIGFYWWNGTLWKYLIDSVVTKSPIIGDGTPSNPIGLVAGNTPGQILKWDGTQWVLANDSVGSGGDNWGSQVAVTSAPIIGDGTNSAPISIQAGTTAGDILVWNGVQWVIQQPGSSNGIAPICSSPSANYIQKWTGSSLCNSLIYDDGTNVGIGTSSPTQKLDVVGNFQFSGALMPGGNPGSVGQVLVSQGANVPPQWQSIAAIKGIYYGHGDGTSTSFSVSVPMNSGDKAIAIVTATVEGDDGAPCEAEFEVRINGSTAHMDPPPCWPGSTGSVLYCVVNSTKHVYYTASSSGTYNFSVSGIGTGVCSAVVRIYGSIIVFVY